MFLKEWSLAPSIFNIKAQGLAHCLHWIKLIKIKFNGFILNALNFITVVQKNNFIVLVFFFSTIHRAILTVTALLLSLLLMQ